MRGFLKNLQQLNRRVFFVVVILVTTVSQLAWLGLGSVNAAPAYPELISQSNSGARANSNSGVSWISSDGRYVLFISSASNLGASQGAYYLRDRYTQQTSIVSTDQLGYVLKTEGLATMSDDARYFYFVAWDDNISDIPGSNRLYVYQKDLQTGAIRNMTLSSGTPTYLDYDVRMARNYGVSNDGKSILVTQHVFYGQANNYDRSVYVYNEQGGLKWTKQCRTIEQNCTGHIGLGISGDGKSVFYTDSTELATAKVLATNIETNVTQVVMNYTDNLLPDRRMSISDDGRYILFAGDALVYDPTSTQYCDYSLNTAGYCHKVIRKDLLTGQNLVVDTRSDGTTPAKYRTTDQYDLSGDGNTVVWTTGSIMRSDRTFHGNSAVYTKNISTGVTSLVSVNSNNVPANAGAGISTSANSLTYNGAEVALSLEASNFGGDKECKRDFGPFIVMEGVHDVYCSMAYVVASSANYIDDTVGPSLVSAGWSENPISSTSSSNLIIELADSGAGVAGGEFFIGDDPGLGEAQELYVELYAESLTTQIGGWDYSPGTYTLHFRTYDHYGNWSGLFSTQFTVTADINAPTLGTLQFSKNPKSISESSDLTVSASDDVSGVANGEYFIGDADPGQGNGAAMSWDGTNLVTTFGTDLPTGVYKISVRAQNNTGNWSDPVSDYLVVYDPSGPRMTGKRTITPSLNNGDVLPGLVSGTQTDAATFAFSVKYDGSGQISSNSDFQLSYQTGTKCKNAAQAQNCHSFNLNANSIAWLTTQGTNNSTGVFQGLATLVVDGVTSQVVFRVTGVDGSRLSSTSSDSFEVRLFAQGEDPSAATPIYVINPTAITQGDIKII